MTTDEEMMVVKDVQVPLSLSGIELYNIKWDLNRRKGADPSGGGLATPEDIAEWVMLLLHQEDIDDPDSHAAEDANDVVDPTKLAGLNDAAIARIALAFKRS
jgi:hypothetical protein